jgi:hypothetical protein
MKLANTSQNLKLFEATVQKLWTNKVSTFSFERQQTSLHLEIYNFFNKTPNNLNDSNTES